MAKQISNTGKRYTDEQKQKILAYVEGQGRGGMSRAQEKYNVSYLTIRSWMKPSKAKKADRPAKVTKTTKGTKKAVQPVKAKVSKEAVTEATLNDLKKQATKLMERVLKLEFPKAPEVKEVPVVEAVPAPVAEVPVQAEVAPKASEAASPVKEAPQVKEAPAEELAAV